MDELKEICAEIAADVPPFEVELDSIGSMQNTFQSLFIGVHDNGGRLRTLRDRLERYSCVGVEEAPYAPHISLAYSEMFGCGKSTSIMIHLALAHAEQETAVQREQIEQLVGVSVQEVRQSVGRCVPLPRGLQAGLTAGGSIKIDAIHIVYSPLTEIPAWKILHTIPLAVATNELKVLK